MNTCMNIRLHDGQITDIHMYLSDLLLCYGIVVLLFVLQRLYVISQLVHECTFKQPKAYLIFHSGMTAASIAKPIEREKRKIHNLFFIMHATFI